MIDQVFVKKSDGVDSTSVVKLKKGYLNTRGMAGLGLAWAGCVLSKYTATLIQILKIYSFQN